MDVGALSVKPGRLERLLTVQHRRNYCPYCQSVDVIVLNVEKPFRKMYCRACEKRFRTVEAPAPGKVWVKR